MSLRDIAWLPLFDGFPLDAQHSVARQWPAVEGTPFKNALFLLPSPNRHQNFNCKVEGDPVSLLWHIPISDAERPYKEEHGANALLDRMQKV